jgi:hypothetical protein
VIRPESGSEPGALDGTRVAQDEEGKEPVAFADAETRERLALPESVEGTKHLD